MSRRKKKRAVAAVDTSTTLASRTRAGGVPAAPQIVHFKSSRKLTAAGPTASLARDCTVAVEPDSDVGDERATFEAGGGLIDLARARHEVFQLGIRGFSRPRRQEAREKKLVKLGAKPPPNEVKNYKELMEELKHKRQEQQQQRIILRKEGVPSAKLPAVKKKFQKARNRNEVRGLDRQAGKFKGGVHLVSKSMIR